jgi:hypothetical protein
MMDAGESHAATHPFISPLLNAATAWSIAAVTPPVSDAEQSAGTDKSAIAAARATMVGLQIFNEFPSTSKRFLA